MTGLFTFGLTLLFRIRGSVGCAKSECVTPLSTAGA